MLTITEKAAAALRRVTGHPLLAETSGLRIARKHPATESLGVSAVKAPEPDDQVVERGQGRLFLGPVAARRLRGKVLDVRDDGGRMQFVVRPD